MASGNDGATYLGFADEAHYNIGRYRGLALVSMRAIDARSLRAEVSAMLHESNSTECKWERVRSAKHRFTAQKLPHWTLDHAVMGSLRVNVLTWDTGTSEDQRQGTHHMKRLRSTYLRLFAHVIRTRWPDACHWLFHPDEQDALDWMAIAQDLRDVATREPARSVAIDGIVPLVSHDEPFIQIADLFAGLAVFSRGEYDDYEQWLCSPSNERGEPSGEQEPPARFSSSLRQRCVILDEFYTECKLRGMHVSLRANRSLRTYDPLAPVAFEWSTPMALEDASMRFSRNRQDRAPLRPTSHRRGR